MFIQSQDYCLQNRMTHCTIAVNIINHRSQLMPKKQTQENNTMQNSQQRFIGQKEHAPQFMKFNKYIERGYRINHNSLSDILKSLFSLHNESVNIWTHLLAALIIFGVIFGLGSIIDRAQSHDDVLAIAKQLNQSIHHPSRNASLNSLALFSLEKGNTQISDDEFQQFNTHIISYLKEVRGKSQYVQTLERIANKEDINIKYRITHKQKQMHQVESELERIVLIMGDPKNMKNQTNLRSILREKLTSIDARINQYAQDVVQSIEMFSKQIFPVSRTPILIFLVSAALCLTFSATFHLFLAFSNKSFTYFRRLDYAGVVILIIGSGFPPLTYASACHHALGTVYLTIMSIVGVVIFITLLCNWIHKEENKKYKPWMFGGFGVAFLIPMAHSIINEIYFDNFGDKFRFSNVIGLYILLGFCYLPGLFIYAYKCPQRFSPGKFDICGSSHQIWHLMVCAGVIVTYIASIKVYEMRRVCPCIPL